MPSESNGSLELMSGWNKDVIEKSLVRINRGIKISRNVINISVKGLQI